MASSWKPYLHSRESRPFTFVHVGEPAVRKGGDIVLEAWHRAFKHRKDVQLIMKCVRYPTCRIKDSKGSIIASPSMYDNVKVISNVYSQAEMWALYGRSDCMVYPSRGEGFGLIPFEAMASGLPTIIPNEGMGDFTRHSTLRLRASTWVNSTEQKIHPGKWMDHDLDELIYLMELAIGDHHYISEDAFAQADILHREYSWGNVAEMVVKRLEALNI
jgi:glycosyltransferase involved in cell wall biosynthesis